MRSAPGHHRTSWRATALGLAVAAIAAPCAAGADTPCRLDLAAEVRAVDRALARGTLLEAVSSAEAALTRCPGQPVLVRLLARAHAAAGNSGAALALLRGHLASRPDDCESWSNLAWAELVANEPADAWQALLAPGCPGTPEEHSRWGLLEALAHRKAGDLASAAVALGALSDYSPMWAEDGRARAGLVRQLDPTWTWPWRTSVELGLGGTTEAFAGSPTDAATSGAKSAIAQLAATSALRAPRAGRVTPFVEASVRGHGIQAEVARELSYLELGGRAGAEVRLGGALLTLAVRREVLHLNQATSRFSEAWRGELDLETGGGLVLFTGGGRREFHDSWRTRVEWDGGGAGALRPGGVPITVALAGRLYDGARAPYDQRGATLTMVSRHPLGSGWLLRASAQGSWDDYPHSRTWESIIAFGSDEGRRDTTMRLSLGAWRVLRRGLQAALTYEYGRRWSSIEHGYQGSFAYREHRALASVRLDLSGNPWQRGRTAPDHVPVDWGLDSGAGPLGGESIRDLVRQDEDLRPDCGCTPH